MSIRSGRVFYAKEYAGIIEERDSGFFFTYDKSYLEKESAKAISLTLPLQKESFFEKQLFSFFDGLIPEGWLLDIAQENWKLNPRDRMGLLLSCCKETIGAVRVEKMEGENE